MTATNHTEHYALSQYTEDDRPTYTGDYNGDMAKIDAAIYAASQSGGSMASVAHTADLTGDGTDDSPLGVADTIARTEDIPSLDGYATTESVTQAIAATIADRLTAGDIKPGNGINIETSGNQVTISYVGGGSAGGLAAVTHDDTLTGNGTTATPLRVSRGTAITQSNTLVADLNDIELGIFAFPGANVQNSPISTYGVVATFQGWNGRATEVQLVIGINSGNAADIWKRVHGTGTDWSPWVQFAVKSDIPDVSALTSRIAALEQQVSALTAAATPGATGLTAEQLDTQYSDTYNIVRVGTPTHSMETEEASYE